MNKDILELLEMFEKELESETESVNNSIQDSSTKQNIEIIFLLLRNIIANIMIKIRKEGLGNI